MGAKAVTALSEWTVARVQRGGRTYEQEYERGKAVTDVRDIGPARATGTTVQFKPDPEIFHHGLTFDYDTLESRLRELAFLNRGLTINLHDERSGKKATFKFDGGISEFVQYVNRGDDVLHPVLYMEKIAEGVDVEVALQYTTSDVERVLCYTNNAYNSIGGTHLSGFRAALTRTLNAYGTKEGLFKNVTPTGEDFREGLTVIIHVKVPEPQFDSQEKKRLNNLEVESIVSGVVGESMAKYVEENPKEAQRIMKKVALSAEAREAAAKAKNDLKKRKSILSGGGLPGKLFDCTTRNRDESELFLVEGDSAGGSAESGRDREFQAILPLRGKPLNVEKARMENMLNNQEITSLISAIGIDIGNNEDDNLKRLRYDKVIIMTDADVDGQHIRTLLLTFFYRQMPRLVVEGHIYVARPPLYKVTEKKHVRFVATAEEMQSELMERGLKGTRLRILRPDGTVERVLEGEALAGLTKLTARLEDALQTLERRGLNLATFLARGNDRGVPVFRVQLAGREEWLHTAADVDRFRQAEQEKLGRELVIGEGAAAPATNGHAETFYVQELHEVREINRSLEELKKHGLLASDLIPAPRIAGREPPPRLALESGGQEWKLAHLRDLVADVRKLGERGRAITRFKGLGEMDPEELWETTLDPEKRTMLQVQLDDAVKADEMFRTLMGEKVEPRRDFITKYALEVKEIDYHGA
jgi:DNA gyrase subunit B